MLFTPTDPEAVGQGYCLGTGVFKNCPHDSDLQTGMRTTTSNNISDPNIFPAISPAPEN